MAIREFEFTVKEDCIIPATEQRVSIQTEHAAARLIFNIADTLKEKLETAKGTSGSIAYRFDCYDSVGGSVKTDTSPLTADSVSFTVGENLTRNGGKAVVYLVITVLDSDEKTVLEMLSYPARLRIERIPSVTGDNGEARESISTMTETAKNAAETAVNAAETAVEAKEQTVLAQTALEEGSEFYFDGNLIGEVGCVIDSTLSNSSDNAIANKAVAKKIAELEASIASTLATAAADYLLNAHPVGSLYFSSASTNPTTLFGGTWERIKDKFILAAGDDYTAGDTGGEAKHKLVIEEIPSHSHGSYYTGHTGAEKTVAWLPSSTTNRNLGYGGVWTGGSQPHNNMPPYEVFYCWKRTA